MSVHKASSMNTSFPKAGLEELQWPKFLTTTLLNTLIPVTITSTVLIRLSTRFWYVTLGICVYSVTRAQEVRHSLTRRPGTHVMRHHFIYLMRKRVVSAFLRVCNTALDIA